VYVETRYYLSFPPFAAVNVRVFWSALGGYILPSHEPIALQWRYNLSTYQYILSILTTTTNPLIATTLRPYVNYNSRVEVSIEPGIPALPEDPLLVIQFLYYHQRWIVVVYEVYFPPTPQPWNGATPNSYRDALRNRTEKLVAFYDTALEGLGSFSHRHLTIHLAPTYASIRYNGDPFYHGRNYGWGYYIEPTDNTAYCMFIDPLRRGWV
jgi:hypothetical protein